MPDPFERVDLLLWSHVLGRWTVVYSGPRCYAEGLRSCFTIRWSSSARLMIQAPVKFL